MPENEPEVLFGEPNGKAFVVEEKRFGPPLSFVGSKLYQSLMFAHMSWMSVKTYIPDDFPQPPGLRGTKISIKHDGLMEPIQQTFRNALTAFLGLYNLMALAGETTLVDRLLAMPHSQFKEWLDRIQMGGSVLG